MFRASLIACLKGFPARRGAHLRLLVKTPLVARDEEIKQQTRSILDRGLDSRISRAKKYGLIPFTFGSDVAGKKAKKDPQSDRFGRHAAEMTDFVRNRYKTSR